MRKYVFNYKLLIKAIVEKLYEHLYESTPGLLIADNKVKNHLGPLIVVSYNSKESENTKEAYIDKFRVILDIKEATVQNNEKLFDLISKVEEAMIGEFYIDAPVSLISVDEFGMQSLENEEQKETRAILIYDFKVSYGYRSKN